MIRRILHAELSDVRSLARDVKRRAVKAFQSNVYLDLRCDGGCLILGPGGTGVLGAGFIVGHSDESDLWPDGAHLLTVGRVTLAAWRGRPS